MRRRTFLLGGIAVAAGVAVPLRTRATSPRPADYDIANGHFYTQAAVQPEAHSGHPQGFAITNEQGIGFWSEFQRLGGVSLLGYPISQRFIWDGHIVQVMQKAVLRWRPSSGRCDLVEVMDEMAANRQAENWIVSQGVPPFMNGITEALVQSQSRLAVLDANPALKKLYTSSPDASFYYGLPTSSVLPISDGWAVRTQRNVLLVWDVDLPWAKAGVAVAGLAGDLLKQSGIFPESIFTPMEAPEMVVPAPAPAPRPAAAPTSAPLLNSNVQIVSTRSGRISWYGPGFHGNVTYSGEIYNMYDPTTTAANLYPIGSWLRVTSGRTGRSVNVRVNDKGAFREPYIVDLSYAAFRQIDDTAAGWINGTISLLSGRP